MTKIIVETDYCDLAVVTEVSCPTCSADTGVPCFTRNGHACQVHQRRVNAWRQMHPERPTPRRFTIVDGKYVRLAEGTR